MTALDLNMFLLGKKKMEKSLGFITGFNFLLKK